MSKKTDVLSFIAEISVDQSSLSDWGGMPIVGSCEMVLVDAPTSGAVWHPFSRPR